MLRRRRAVRQSPNGGLYGGVSIVLADGQNPMRRSGGKCENVWLHSERRMAAVRYHDHQIGALDRAARALHAEPLHGVVCLADARRVDEPQQHAADHRLLLHGVARRAGKVGDDGAVVAHKRVEQRAFARVRRADDGGRRAAFEHASARKGAEQRRERLFALRERPLRLGKREVLDVLVGIVHHGVEAAGEAQQRVVDLFERAAQRAVHLGGGVPRRLGGLGVNEVDDRLRLGEVHFAVQKRALGKFPRPRLPRACGKRGAQDLLQNDRRAVAVQLRALLARVAVSGGEHHRQRVVERAALGVAHRAVGHAPRRKLRGRTTVHRREQRREHAPRLRAAQAHDADRGGRGRGGDGSNGVGHKTTSLMIADICRYDTTKREK